MEGLNPLPKAISHKKLDFLLKNAVQGKDSLDRNDDENSIKGEEFLDSLKVWGETSEKLLNTLKRKESFISEGRTSNSLMALGAFESHLNIALQALKASEDS